MMRIMLALLALSGTAAIAEGDSPAIDGTWKIAAEQHSFEPEGGAIPFTPEGREQYEANRAHREARDFEAYDYTISRCASPGLPRLMLTPDRFRIFQRPGHVLIQFEWNRLYRQIDLGALPQPQLRVADDLPLLGAGDEALVGRAIPISRGHWEGDTLVVASEGFIDYTLIDDLVPHGYDLKLTERIRLKDENTLENHITIEDPEYFTRPWETVVTYKRQPDTAFREDVCLDRRDAGQAVLSRSAEGK